MKITQVYENDKSHPLEIVFKMPVSDTFAISKLTARFLGQDGKVTYLETQVREREAAQAKFEDTVA